mmetsp:Transcript_40204/g.106669  ORF Transcript_40204/g.106669 Transcript_40204/m.106669 type:complete len:80 (-) Transcript_40204:333-572(-)
MNCSQRAAKIVGRDFSDVGGNSTTRPTSTDANQDSAEDEHPPGGRKSYKIAGEIAKHRGGKDGLLAPDLVRERWEDKGT